MTGVREFRENRKRSRRCKPFFGKPDKTLRAIESHFSFGKGKAALREGESEYLAGHDIRGFADERSPGPEGSSKLGAALLLLTGVEGVSRDRLRPTTKGGFL